LDWDLDPELLRVRTRIAVVQIAVDLVGFFIERYLVSTFNFPLPSNLVGSVVLPSVSFLDQT